MLLKSVLTKGEGYDRPDEIDEIQVDMKIYQVNKNKEEKVFVDVKDLSTLMSDRVNICLTAKKVLQSMKPKEKV